MRWFPKFNILLAIKFTLITAVLLVVVYFSIGFFMGSTKFFSPTRSRDEIPQEITSLLDSAKLIIRHDPVKADSLSKAAKQLLLGNKNDSLRYKIDYTLGEIAVYRSNYPEALQYLLSSKAVLEKNKEMDSITRFDYARTLNKLGQVYYELEKTDKALKYLQQSLSIYKTLSKDENIVRTISNIGGIYYKEGQIQKAIDAYEEVLGYDNLDQIDDIQILYSNLGGLNLLIGKNIDGLEYLNKAESVILKAQLKEKNTLQLSKDYSRVLYNKAYYYRGAGETDNYTEHLLKSLKVLDTFFAPNEARAPLISLHELYRENGNYQAAYETLLKYQSIHDTLFNLESERQIAKLETQHEVFRNQQAIELKKRNTAMMYWAALSVLLLFLILVLIFLYRQKLKFIKAEQERHRLAKNKLLLESKLDVQEEILHKKKKEVHHLASQIVEKNENILSLKEHLNQINTSAQKHLNQGKITELIKNTREGKNLEADRKQFLLNLEQSSVVMFEKLDTEFNGLTNRQKHLAALIKYGFTAKEISVLFNISHKSVQTGKYRLKKILKLTNEQDLEVFLKKY
ncbi:tetratricopeptide repeat protein [Aequorivita sediminis]|uniref:tetratricopeptide repeat protein n=1 Tax=Aequorivita sediminis TaxID=3073653 RepID=UPI0028ACF0E1|nr:tetratricopeptide repeat protein [Aequorivita sp. F6058]